VRARGTFPVTWLVVLASRSTAVQLPEGLESSGIQPEKETGLGFRPSSLADVSRTLLNDFCKVGDFEAQN
jgi:hypothetical protein